MPPTPSGALPPCPRFARSASRSLRGLLSVLRGDSYAVCPLTRFARAPLRVARRPLLPPAVCSDRAGLSWACRGSAEDRRASLPEGVPSAPPRTDAHEFYEQLQGGTVAPLGVNARKWSPVGSPPPLSDLPRSCVALLPRYLVLVFSWVAPCPAGAKRSAAEPPTVGARLAPPRGSGGGVLPLCRGLLFAGDPRAARAPPEPLRGGYQKEVHHAQDPQDPQGTESDLARRPSGLNKGDESPLPLGIIHSPPMEQNSPFVYLMSDLSFLMI